MHCELKLYVIHPIIEIYFEVREHSRLERFPRLRNFNRVNSDRSIVKYRLYVPQVVPS